jgi:hypothetical protein
VKPLDRGHARPVVSTALVTFADLLRQSYDLDELTRTPDPPFTAAQASSYDRASKAPGADGWFANHDFGNFVAVETRGDHVENVMLDAKGPGVVTRLWSANPSGILRLYVDGDAPALTVRMADLMTGGVVRAPFAAVQARGYDVYFPFAFAHSCKVTVESPDAASMYYQIGYRTYGADVSVEPFSPALVDSPLLDDVARRLTDAAPIAPTHTASLDGTGEIALDAPSGGGAIDLLSIAPHTLDPDALRAARLVTTFDGETTIDAPLGDFFGGAAQPFATVALARTEDRLESRFVMPFQARAVLRFEGLAADVALRVVPRPWTDRSLYFHAAFSANDAMPVVPLHSVRLLDAKGPGRLAGVTLVVDNHAEGWWGEGDEHVFVDGEAFPRFFGTGTEDHFGYAFCSRVLFGAPYVALTRVAAPDTGPCAPSFLGKAAMTRAFVLDAIPFGASVGYELEVLHWNDAATVDMDAVTYFYAR